MKNLIFLAIGIIVGIIGYHFIYDFINEDKNIPCKDSLLGLTPPTEKQVNFIKQVEEELKNEAAVRRGTGVRISKERAWNHVQDFGYIKLALKPAFDAMNLVVSKSYSFGIDEIAKLCEDIEYLNSTREAGDKLTGIRVHLGQSSRTVKDKETGVDRPVFYVDAFITPVDENGNHIFDDPKISYTDVPDPLRVDSKRVASLLVGSDNSGSLNASNPCPDHCGSQ